MIYNVSIPFKREGLSERYALSFSPFSPILVSIPFKREGLSEPGHSLRLSYTGH